ncbi:MAG TPA: hypothetical protein VEZ41_15925 [Allosphingosinicella sp.]|nr:hypothetical protein [Allosphingosinicella sp.]
MVRIFLLVLALTSLGACGGSKSGNNASATTTITTTTTTAGMNSTMAPMDNGTMGGNMVAGNMMSGGNMTGGNMLGGGMYGNTTSGGSMGGEIPPPDSADAPVLDYCRSAELVEAECTVLANRYRSLEEGVGALNAPSEMIVGQNYTVALAIGRDEDASEVVASAKGEAGPTSAGDVGEIKLGQRMRVTLSGSAFEIKAEGEPERELGLARQAVWRWQVSPTRDGAQNLVAHVEPVTALPNGRPVQLELARRQLDVQVSVTPEVTMGLIERFLKSATGVVLALAALIGAISLVVWRVRKLRRGPGQGNP